VSNDYDLPTIEQILRKADALGSEPMSDEEARAWFEFTMKQNKEKRS
jgi:hypothetical protein